MCLLDPFPKKSCTDVSCHATVQTCCSLSEETYENVAQTARRVLEDQFAGTGEAHEVEMPVIRSGDVELGPEHCRLAYAWMNLHDFGHEFA